MLARANEELKFNNKQQNIINIDLGSGGYNFSIYAYICASSILRSTKFIQNGQSSELYHMIRFK